MAGAGEDPAGTAAVDPGVALRLVAAAAWHVVQERQIHDFPRVLALLEAVWDAAPDLVHYRHLAKLRLGLQAKVSRSRKASWTVLGHRSTESPP